MLDGGNRPEEFALPFQFGAIALFLGERRAGPSRWRWTLIGIAAAFAVLLKPTVLGVWAAIYLAEAARAWQLRSLGALARPVLLGALGVLFVIVPVGAYLVASGAGNDFVDQVIRFNIEYSRSSLADRIGALGAGVQLTLFSGLFPVAFVGWVTAVVQLARRTAAVDARPLLVVAVLALPLDFALASATGRPYREYFLGCLAAQGILAAVAASWALPTLERVAARLAVSSRVVSFGVLGACVVLFASAIPAVTSKRSSGSVGTPIHFARRLSIAARCTTSWRTVRPLSVGRGNADSGTSASNSSPGPAGLLSYAIIKWPMFT